MKKLCVTTMALVVMTIFIPSAQAITIKVATIRNGFVHVEGDQAPKGVPVYWEGVPLTEVRTTNGGAFKFDTTFLPRDCVGNLVIGPEAREVVINDCTPAPINIEAAVPQTGQTRKFADGDDGDYEAGVQLPTPRFTDNGNGTLTDNLTGLIWLKNANCSNASSDWATALDDVASLNADGTMNSNLCGDTSKGGDHQTDWRLPNIRELYSLFNFDFCESVDSDCGLGTYTWMGCGTINCPFTNFASAFGNYWSSSANSRHFPMSPGVWVVNAMTAEIMNIDGTTNAAYVLAVRGGS